MTRRAILSWRVAADGAVSLLNAGAVVAVIWPHGRRWRVAAADDSRPGDICPTLDEAKAAAMVIARNRMSVAGAPAVSKPEPKSTQ
jgi:hypothetical protein